MRLTALSPGRDGTFYLQGLQKNLHLHVKAGLGPQKFGAWACTNWKEDQGISLSTFHCLFFFFPDPRDFAECATEKACSSPTPHLINWKLTFSLTHRWGRPARIFQRVYTHMGSHWPWLRMKFQLIDAGRIDRIYLKWNFHFRSWLPKHVFFLMSTRSPRLGCDVLSLLRSPIQAAIDFAASRGSNLLANNTPNLCVLTCNKKTPDESMSILRPLPLLILSHVQA